MADIFDMKGNNMTKGSKIDSVEAHQVVSDLAFKRLSDVVNQNANSVTFMNGIFVRLLTRLLPGLDIEKEASDMIAEAKAEQTPNGTSHQSNDANSFA